MKIIDKISINFSSSLIVFNYIIFYCISSNFLSIKSSCRSFDWTSKSIIIVALMICHLNNFIFSHIRGIYYNFVMDRTSRCSFRIFVCHHIKIKLCITIVENNICLHYCTFFWIFFFFVGCFKKPSYIVFVY